MFTNAHEFGWYKDNINNEEAMKMDLHNNQRGRTLGEMYSLKQLSKVITNDIAVGNAAIVKDGKSVLSYPEFRGR